MKFNVRFADSAIADGPFSISPSITGSGGSRTTPLPFPPNIQLLYRSSHCFLRLANVYKYPFPCKIRSNFAPVVDTADTSRDSFARQARDKGRNSLSVCDVFLHRFNLILISSREIRDRDPFPRGDSDLNSPCVLFYRILFRRVVVLSVAIEAR